MKLLAFTIGGREVLPPAGVPTGDFKTGGATSILETALGILLAVGVIMVAIFMVWGGIMWITSGGDKQKVAAARNRIIYSIVGLVVIVLSVFIVNLVLYFLGADQIGK